MLSSLYFITLFMMAGNVMGNRMIRFTFNNGTTPTPGYDECTAADNRIIDPLFDLSNHYVRGRRDLQSVITPVADPNDHEYNYHHHRELYPAACRDKCIGFARGTCRVTGCNGYRRSLVEAAADDKQNHREAYAPCDIQIEGLHFILDSYIAMNMFSEPCKRYLTKSKRKAECYDDVIYGEIESFTFRNMKLGTVLRTNVQNGYSVCSNIPLNVEAVANPCVVSVNFTMTGPSNFNHKNIDNSLPMMLFNTTAQQSTFGGRSLLPGSYRITAIPDNFAYKQKTLDFKVVTCP